MTPAAPSTVPGRRHAGRYRFIPPQMAAAAWLALTVLFGGLAMRRLARVG